MKICVICFDFKSNNLKMQPWIYFYELALALTEGGFEVLLVTDYSDLSKLGNIRVCSVGKLFTFFHESNSLINTINGEAPDLIFTNVANTSFLRNSKLNKPVIGVITGPLYSISEIFNVGIRELIRHPRYLIRPILSSLIPKFLIRRTKKYFTHFLVLSEYNKKKLQQYGINTDKIIKISPGFDEIFLQKVSNNHSKDSIKEINPEHVPIILYFTSPITLRGTDILIKAFARVRRKKPCKLIFLARHEQEKLLDEVKLLKKVIDDENMTDSITIISQNLHPKEIRGYLLQADVICLPFKIVISDMPISIFECMALGKPVISTRIGCIPEIIEDPRVIVEQNNKKDLANVLLNLIQNRNLRENIGENNKNKILTRYPSWPLIRKEFVEIVKYITNYRGH